MMKRLLSAVAALALFAAAAQAAPIPGNAIMVQPTNPALTASATPVMMGIGSTNEFTPHGDGIGNFTVVGTALMTAASAGGTVQIEYGVGAPPANAAAPTTAMFACGSPVKITGNASTAVVAVPFAVTCVAYGLNLNAGYWIDLAASSVTGNFTITNLTVTAIEE